MPKKIKLTEPQVELKNRLEGLYNKVWEYIESYQKSLSVDEANKLYEDMAQTAYNLHISLKNSGNEPKHHKYMIENRGCTPQDVRFYEHVHPVQDLLSFIEDVHANDDPEDKTIGKIFSMKVFSKRWGHYDPYEITRTKEGWVVKGASDSYPCDKSMHPGLNKLLEHDSICYPKNINIFFEWLWDRAAEDGLNEAAVQKAITKLGKWISECEMRAPRSGVFNGLI